MSDLAAEVREAFARFRGDLAFTAPELADMRVDQLEEAVLGLIKPDGGVSVQHQRTFDPPLSAGTLRNLLTDIPDHAEVDLLDGELIAVTWNDHVPDALRLGEERRLMIRYSPWRWAVAWTLAIVPGGARFADRWLR